VAGEVLVGTTAGTEVDVGVAVGGTGVCVAVGGAGVAVRRSGVCVAAGVVVGGMGVSVGATTICAAVSGTDVAVGASAPQATATSRMTSTNGSHRPDVNMALLPSWVASLALAARRCSQLVPEIPARTALWLYLFSDPLPEGLLGRYRTDRPEIVAESFVAAGHQVFQTRWAAIGGVFLVQVERVVVGRG
jgi:hypothetical protein